eukprot:scpid77719/ scgid1771/ 
MPSWETERNLVFPIHRVMQCWLACTMSTSNGNVLEVSDSSEEESEEDEYETEEDNKEDENEAEVEDEPGEACARLPKAKGASISRVRSFTRSGQPLGKRTRIRQGKSTQAPRVHPNKRIQEFPNA